MAPAEADRPTPADPATGVRITFNDLLRLSGYNPDKRGHIALVRHRPFEAKLARVMPWIIAERPDLFETYQSVPGYRAARSLRKAAFIASFLGLAPGKAHFIGLYQINGSRELDFDAFWKIPENREMESRGYHGLTREEADKRHTVSQFDLKRLPFYPEWRGRLVIDFAPPERAWVRQLANRQYPIAAIREESAFAEAPPAWRNMILDFAELQTLPASWRSRLAEWRGIYLIFDRSDGKAYVGSACGEENLLGRWRSYASSGHGGNHELRGRDPASFRFSILERLSPDTTADEVIGLENSWKERLHTRMPHGLNVN